MEYKVFEFEIFLLPHKEIEELKYFRKIFTTRLFCIFTSADKLFCDDLFARQE